MCAMDGQANTVMFAAVDVAVAATGGVAAVILTVVVAVLTVVVATTGCVRFRFFDSLLIVQ